MEYPKPENLSEKIIIGSFLCEKFIIDVFDDYGKRRLRRNLFSGLKEVEFYLSEMEGLKRKLEIDEHPSMDKQIYNLVKNRIKYDGEVSFPTYSLQKNRGNCLAQTSLMIAMMDGFGNLEDYFLVYSDELSILFTPVVVNRHVRLAKDVGDYYLTIDTTKKIEKMEKMKPDMTKRVEFYEPEYIVGLIVDHGESIAGEIIRESLKHEKGSVEPEEYKRHVNRLFPKNRILKHLDLEQAGCQLSGCPKPLKRQPPAVHE